VPSRSPVQRPWKHGGVALGYVYKGVHYIDRTVHGRRFRLSTGCRTPEAALTEYQRFEKDPARYVPRGKAGAGWDAAVPGFLRYSESVLLNSARWVDKQEAYLANFGAFVRGAHRVFGSLDAFTASDVRSFIAALTEGAITGRRVGAPTVNRHLATLKGFMGWARSERMTLNAADSEVPMVREDKGVRLPGEVAPERWRAVHAELDDRGLERWRLACEVLLGTGLRYGELARLRAEHVHGAGIHVPKAKARRGRSVPASARVVAAARRLCVLGGVPDDEAGQLDHRLRVATKAAGVERYSAHELRHTYATVSLRSGASLRDVQEWMGHASIRTTERYLHALRVRDGSGRKRYAPL
jgi:integrase/recombinase XerC